MHLSAAVKFFYCILNDTQAPSKSTCRVHRLTGGLEENLIAMFCTHNKMENINRPTRFKKLDGYERCMEGSNRGKMHKKKEVGKEGRNFYLHRDQTTGGSNRQ